MNRCGYTWQSGVNYAEPHACYEQKGHEGEHVSINGQKFSDPMNVRNSAQGTRVMCDLHPDSEAPAGPVWYHDDKHGIHLRVDLCDWCLAEFDQVFEGPKRSRTDAVRYLYQRIREAEAQVA